MKMNMYKVMALAVLALALTPVIQAEMGPSCHMGMGNPSAAAKLTAKVGKGSTAFEPFSPTSLLAKLNLFSSPLPMPQQSGNNKYECPRMKAEQVWKEWRVRNPNAPSRYAGKKKGDLKLSLSASSQLNADDAEPDPGFGQCGCDPATALGPGGCGWFHENIWQ